MESDVLVALGALKPMLEGELVHLKTLISEGELELKNMRGRFSEMEKIYMTIKKYIPDEEQKTEDES